MPPAQQQSCVFLVTFFHPVVNFKMTAKPYFKGSELAVSLPADCEMLAFALLRKGQPKGKVESCMFW